MDPPLQRALHDKIYEKRKAAALELEKVARECLANGNRERISQIVYQLCGFLSSSPPQNVNARSGGLIGLAGIGIALGVEIAPYLETIVPPVLACFTDPDSKIRYFACESFYNIAKVCKGEILIYFNEIFDALSKLAADSELSVKNGAELLDRLLKDIVSEAAPYYVSQYQDVPLIRAKQEQDAAASREAAAKGLPGSLSAEGLGIVTNGSTTYPEPTTAVRSNKRNKTFSLEHFVPLLSERMYVISPFTRNFLVSWVTVIGSVPDLELVSYLPAFLDALLKYLSDPNTDVRMATANVLGDFLREIREAAEVEEKLKAEANERKAQRDEQRKEKREKERELARLREIAEARAVGESLQATPSGAASEDDRPSSPETTKTKLQERADKEEEEEGEEEEEEEAGLWVPGQGVHIDHAAIMEILIQHIAFPDEEIQSTTLQWIAQFLLFVKDVVVPFTPRLIPAILPSLAHHIPQIQSAANQTNVNLYRVIQSLPSPPQPQPAAVVEKVPPSRSAAASPSPREGALGLAISRAMRAEREKQKDAEGPEKASPITDQADLPNVDKPVALHKPVPRRGTESAAQTPTSRTFSLPPAPSGYETPPEKSEASPVEDTAPEEQDPFDYQATVNALTLQFLDEHEETRVAALEWLIMLHQKAPRKILAMDDGTFPALLKTLSDPSEEVIKCDLQLLAQISSSSEDSYFHSFLANLLSLFSTDRRLLETRGSLIIRQLCLSLNTERIFRTFAEILEKDEDLEFARIMVQNLNIILITSPELAEFRKRLRNLDSKDGQALFSALYRSWCHNAVATFSLCLLAQAYEHASNLLQIFADLEITVSLLIQIDKLVQLLESPIFTALRLQLLEPEKNPYLFKCLYGLLMLLPQSSAFATLRNRLNAVSSMGFLHMVPRSTYASATRSKIGGREDIKWQELLTHFRSVQGRHERARRQALHSLGVVSSDPFSGGVEVIPSSAGPGAGVGSSRAASTGVSPPSGGVTPGRLNASMTSARKKGSALTTGRTADGATMQSVNVSSSATSTGGRTGLISPSPLNPRPMRAAGPTGGFFHPSAGAMGGGAGSTGGSVPSSRPMSPTARSGVGASGKRVASARQTPTGR